MVIKKIRISLQALGVYRGLLKDEVIHKLDVLLENIDRNPEDSIRVLSSYNEFYYALMKKGRGCSFKDYMITKILFEDNVYARQVQTKEEKELSPSIYKATQKDLELLYNIASIDPKEIKNAIVSKTNYDSFIMNQFLNLPQWDMESKGDDREEYKDIKNKLRESISWKNCVNDIAIFHKKHGSGMWSQFKGFVWEDEKLQGVVSLDPIRLDQLIGYDLERQKVVDNTKAFLNGYPANNVLLYGSRGTGKSSTVKALLNEYHTQGLRIIEISKKDLETFPKIIRKIKEYPQKFILFIDDLSFEDSEGTYTALKAVLEGGLETRPSNVVIYATSNRRHLIKEKFSDRAGILSSNKDDEIRAMDTMEEKLSLADRFGITVTFTSPNQKQYLKIVEGLVESRGIQIDLEELHKKAIQWEMWYNGRSPRTAKQFVDWLEANV